MVFIKKDFYKLFLYIRDKNLKDIINNREIFNTTEFEDFNNEDIQIVLYVTAIDNRDFTALNNLINYDIDKKNIDYEIYIRGLLIDKRLEFIIKMKTEISENN